MPRIGGQRSETAGLFRDLFCYVLKTYRRRLEIFTDKPWYEIATKLNLTPAETRKIEAQTNKKRRPRTPISHTREILVDFVATRLKEEFPGHTDEWYKSWFNSWFMQPNEEELRRLITEEKSTDTGSPESTSAGSGKTPKPAPTRSTTNPPLVLPFAIPGRSDIAPELKADFCHHFIAYHFAFEGESLEHDLVAREVVTFKEDPAVGRSQGGARFTMSFKYGNSDVGRKARTFEGWMMPLGQSLMCIGVHLDGANGDPRNRDRGRSLFMRNEIFRGCAGFGMLSTTRASGNEACAACVLLFKVDAEISNKEIDRFRQQVTIIRPLRAILDADFKGIGRRGEKSLKTFLDNQPRGHGDDPMEDQPRSGSKDGTPPDAVLKLWYDRFGRDIYPIVKHVYNSPKVKAPFKANWKQGLLADSE